MPPSNMLSGSKSPSCQWLSWQGGWAGRLRTRGEMALRSVPQICALSVTSAERPKDQVGSKRRREQEHSFVTIS